MEKTITIRFPKLEATSVDEMIDKLTELKQELDANGERKVYLFTIAVVKESSGD